MSYIMVDIESDGPVPGDYSMFSFGAVVVDDRLDKTFQGKLKPISDRYENTRLDICSTSRKETLTYEDPKTVMESFEVWILENTQDKPMFISDNNGFDWMFICWYFNHFLGRNPFGYSSTNLGSLYKGLVKDMTGSFKHLRETDIPHDPLEDAIINARAAIRLSGELGLKGLY